jgi:signal transduction histidine kinase
MSRYVAHEMRTPLTIIQGEAENVLSRPASFPEDYKKVLHSSLEEIQRMSEIVTTVLQVGKTQESILRYQPVSFDLTTWVEQNKKHWEELLSRPIQTMVPEGACRVHGDPKLLYRLVDNLIRNIRDHTPPQTRCIMILEKTSHGVSLCVEDNGGGLSARDLDSLNRVGRYSDVTAVGLNLCFAIAEMCGNKLRFTKAEGQGLRVEIWMS